MQYYGVPGVSVTVINEGQIEWSSGYGVRSAGTTDSVTMSTLFQAASVSKPVTALASMMLVDQSILSLDADVNQWLKSWKIPDNQHTHTQPVTLRMLLTHSAGINVGGFPGYEAGEKIPSTAEVLDGKGNTDVIKVDTLPGTKFNYSGGGYTIVQMLIEDITGKPFAMAMKDLVLDPIGMSQSTFSENLPKYMTREVALAHQNPDRPIEGGWHIYPEGAAAGLWTTSVDLAKFLIRLSEAYLGADCPTLSTRLAKEMLTPQIGNYGIGPGLGGEGKNLLFAHPGGNVGFRAFTIMYPHLGKGLVVMSNADKGGDLNMEIVRAVAQVYDWPDFKPEIKD
jgi:CubicO group peptidase (beta-lactamase class C family)